MARDEVTSDRIRDGHKMIRVPLNVLEVPASKGADRELELVDVGQYWTAQPRQKFETTTVGHRVGVNQADLCGGTDARGEFRNTEQFTFTQPSGQTADSRLQRGFSTIWLLEIPNRRE